MLMAASLVAGGLLGAGPALGAPQEPPPGPPPGPVGIIPPLAGIGSALAQSGSAPAGPLGLPDLSSYGPNLLLGQTPFPAAPQDAAQPATPNFDAFNPDYLLPQNTAPAAPGQGELAGGIGPSPEHPGTGRIAFLRRLYEMYREDRLDGALLGQLPKDAEGRPILPAEESPDVG